MLSKQKNVKHEEQAVEFKAKQKKTFKVINKIKLKVKKENKTHEKKIVRV